MDPGLAQRFLAELVPYAIKNLIIVIIEIWRLVAVAAILWIGLSRDP